MKQNRKRYDTAYKLETIHLTTEECIMRGRPMNRMKVLCISILFIIFSLSVYAEAATEHPLIRPFPGSTLNDNMCKYNEFNEYAFTVIDPDTNKETKAAVRGKFWALLYTLYTPDGKWDRSHSILEYKENYKAAALEKGGTVRYDKGSTLVFTLPNDDGGKTWVQLHVTNGAQQYLWIIEEAGFKKSLTFGPAEMKAALDAEGRVQLHDILFDLDKATLKAESSKQLQDVVTLLKQNPALKIEVQGHTDDQGAEDYNMKLSQSRAETVVTYLGIFGIDAGRLTPKGFGESKPVMSNDTEEGRAKNRRVELVKQ